MDESEKDNRLWRIQYSLPKDIQKGRSWNVNHSLSVAAISVEIAITALKKEHPDATIWQINHQGILHIQA